MEQETKIRTSDKKIIYGILRGSIRRPLIVFVHGLTGNMNEHIFFNGARYAEKHGFSSFRFNLYDWRRGARKLQECTLQTHANDLDGVIDFLRRKGAKKVLVVGHSYGGKTILLSKKKDFNAVVLWDPSHNVFPLYRKVQYVKLLGMYADFEDAYGILFGKKMVQEEMSFPWRKKISAIHVPTKFVCAGRGVLIRGCRQYYKETNAPKELVIVKNATHCFDEEGAEEKLLEETIKWFKHLN